MKDYSRLCTTRDSPASLNTREERLMENTNQTLTAVWLLVMYLIHDHHRHGDVAGKEVRFNGGAENYLTLKALKRALEENLG